MSVVSMRFLYRLHSSEYFDLWNNEDCAFEVLWIIPVLNTISVIVLFTMMMCKVAKRKIKSKLLNTDL